MHLRGKQLVLSLAAIVVIAIASLWIIARRSPPVTRQLPDGSVLSLKRVSYESPHRIRVGDRWQDYLGAALPEKWAKQIGSQFAVVGGQTNALAVYLEWEDHPTPANLRASTLDEHGCEFGLTTPYSVSLGAGREAVVFNFYEFPRGSKAIGLRVYLQQPSNTWSTLAEFPLLNPVLQPLSNWQAEAVPITKTVDGVEFTLRKLRTGIASRHWPPGPPVLGEYRGAWFTFRLTENGKPAASWQLAGFGGISDGLGNRVGRGGYSSSSNPGEAEVVLDGGLCDQATVWKVDVEFARAQDFPAEDLWTIRSVPVPAAGTLSMMDVVTNLHGMSVCFCGIVGANYTNAGPRWANRPPRAHVVYTNLPETVQFKIVSAVDERGRKVLGAGSSGESANHYFELKLPADARTVDLTFAITKRVSVQYLVKPSRLSEAELEKLRKR